MSCTVKRVFVFLLLVAVLPVIGAAGSSAAAPAPASPAPFVHAGTDGPAAQAALGYRYQERPLVDFRKDAAGQLGSVAGTITVSDRDGGPPNGGTVHLLTADFSQSLFSVNTQEDGSFVMAAIPEGTYRIWAIAQGYGNKYYPGTYTSINAQTITVAASQVTENVDIELDPEATLYGKVTNSATGEPIGGVEVSAWPKTGGAIISFRSSMDGLFLIRNLSAGTFVAKAELVGYAIEYFENKPTLDQATPIVTTIGENIPGIDFSLDTQATGGEISGRVIAGDTGDWQDNRAYISVGTTDFQHVTSVQADAEGDYTVSDLQPGQYIIYARAPEYGGLYYPAGADDDGSEPVEVIAGETTSGIDITLYPEAKITGRITSHDTGEPLGGITVQAWPHAGGIIRETVTNSAGLYTIMELATADYSVMASADGYANATFGNVAVHPVYVNPIHAQQPGTTEGIDLIMHRAASIELQAYAADGATPVEGVIFYFLAAPEGWERRLAWFEDTPGGAVLDNWLAATLPTYLWVRAPEGYQNVWYDGAAGSNTSSAAAQLPLVKNGKIQVTLKLPEATTATITPKDGGTIELAAQTTTTVEFPPDAVGDDAVATLRTDRNDPVNAGEVGFLGDPVELTLGSVPEMRRTALPHPFTITVSYEDEDLPMGVPEEALGVYWLDPNAAVWVPLETTIDAAGNVISAQSGEIGRLAVFGRRPFVALPVIMSGS